MARATSSNQPQSIVCSPPVSLLPRKVSVTPLQVIFGKESSRVSRPGEDSTLGRMGEGLSRAVRSCLVLPLRCSGP